MSTTRSDSGRDEEHELLCRLFGAAPVRRHRLGSPVSDFDFWQSRLVDRRGEVVFGLVLADPSGMVVTHNPDYPEPDLFRVPSGGIAHGETIADCLAREVAEELGTGFEVWRYAGKIEYTFTAVDGCLTFPSYCFILRQPQDDPRLPALGGDPAAEVDAWLAATPRQLSQLIGRLRRVGGEWADWGRYRATSTALVASAWRNASERGAAEADHPQVWPHDLSLPLDPAMATYGGDPPPRWRYTMERGEGAPSGWSVSEWTMSTHAGTHVDAPAHWFAGGQTVDRLPLSALCGPAVVLDCRLATAAGRPVRPADLRQGGLTRPDSVAGCAVLVRLGLGDQLAGGTVPPELHHGGLDREAAQTLVDRGAVAVGIESLSVDPAATVAQASSHQVLLGAGLPVIEGLNLTGVRRGPYWLSAAPIRLAGAEAAPCRALLWPRQGMAMTHPVS